MLFACNCFAQTIDKAVSGANGNTVVRPNVSVDWTIGQTVAASSSAGTYMVLQGFHENVKEITGVQALSAIVDVKIYPVPADDKLYVSIVQAKASALSVQVHDMRGEMVKRVELVQKEKMQLIALDISNLVPASYIVSVHDGETVMYKATIVKTR